jgi:hypothetical protein
MWGGTADVSPLLDPGFFITLSLWLWADARGTQFTAIIGLDSSEQEQDQDGVESVVCLVASASASASASATEAFTDMDSRPDMT